MRFPEGSRLRSLRLSMRLRQMDVAKRGGLTAANLSRIEAGLQDPTLTALRKIAKGLGLSIPELLTALFGDEGRAAPGRVARRRR